MLIEYPVLATTMINFSFLGTILVFGLMFSFTIPNTYAQSSDTFQTEMETQDYLIEMIVNGSPIIFDKPGQAIPILANGSDYTFDIMFRNKGNFATTIENVDYNVVILADDKELFNAQNQTSEPLRTPTGNATLQYRFEKLGQALVRISILGIDSKPVSNNSAEIYFQVNDSRTIPEFPIAQLVIVASISGVIITLFVQQKGLLSRKNTG